MGETDGGGNWVLFWWAEPCSVNLQSNIRFMGGAVFPPCYLPGAKLWWRWCSGVGEDSSGLQKVPCRRCYTPCSCLPCGRPPRTHASTWGSWALTGRSGAVSCGGHCSFLLGPGAQGSVCILLESVVGLMVTSSKRAMPHSSLLHPEPLPLRQPIADTDPDPHRRHSETVLSQFLRSLWVLVWTRFVWVLLASLAGMGLIVNMILPLLPSCWGFSALGLGCGKSPHIPPAPCTATNVLGITSTLFQQHKRTVHMDITDGQHQHQIVCILCSQRWRSPIQSAKTRQVLTVAQITKSLLPNSDLNWRK